MFSTVIAGYIPLSISFYSFFFCHFCFLLLAHTHRHTTTRSAAECKSFFFCTTTTVHIPNACATQSSGARYEFMAQTQCKVQQSSSQSYFSPDAIVCGWDACNSLSMQRVALRSIHFAQNIRKTAAAPSCVRAHTKVLSTLFHFPWPSVWTLRVHFIFIS